MARTVKRLRGLKGLVHDLVDATTHLVMEGHESTARSVRRVTDLAPEPVADVARTVDSARRMSTDGVLTTIRVVNRAVEVATDLGIDVAQLIAARRATEEEPRPGLAALPMRSDAIESWPWLGDATLGLLNGAIGDRLASRDNGLDLGMLFRVGDRYVALDDVDAMGELMRDAGPRVAIFVHGLGTTEWCWSLEAEAYHGDPAVHFGSLLQKDLGYFPVFVRYNTGRHVSENGRELAAGLASLMTACATPPEELVLIGHSMGGLVVRSACHYAQEAGHPWVELVRRVFCLGSPHGGAPLEKAGNVLTGILGAIDLPATLVIARLLEGRSAGIKDLRHGSLVDEDWAGRDPDALIAEARREIPMLPHASYHFVSATLTRDPAHPMGALIGDLLVRVPSALLPASERGPRMQDVVRERHFEVETATYGGVMHHQLQCHPDVYEVIRRACAGGDDVARPSDG
ncbi:MAG: lipase family alpha/beta hydrolase [Sandaracinaceae bacterium]